MSTRISNPTIPGPSREDWQAAVSTEGGRVTTHQLMALLQDGWTMAANGLWTSEGCLRRLVRGTESMVVTHLDPEPGETPACQPAPAPLPRPRSPLNCRTAHGLQCLAEAVAAQSTGSLMTRLARLLAEAASQMQAYEDVLDQLPRETQEMLRERRGL